LTKRPEVGTTVDVAILTDGLADVVSVNGVTVTQADYQEIGVLRPTQLFTGSIAFEDLAGKGTLTRGTGADLGSFIDEGFADGDLLCIGGAGMAYNGDYFIHSVTDQTITLTAAFGVLGQVEVTDSVALSDLTREGVYMGEVTVNTTDRRLIRTDDSSWLADGFLEGQRVRVTNAANPAQFADFKIAIIRGENDTKDEKIEFTAVGALPAWLTGTLDVDVNRIAVVATFTDTDWYVQQTITLEADPLYEVPSTREGVKVFPVSTHLLSKLRGPLAVEGGVTGADRSLSNGLKLPGESDDFLFAIGAQPPESQQIDVLNIFNDSSQADGVGVMTETTLRGFGMADDLDFSAVTGDTFGEPSIFPGGISFGKVNFGSSGFSTDSGESTIEVVNLMLGEGNDVLDIEGTLNPAPFVSAQNEFVFTPDGGGDGGIIVRAGFDWKAQGFLAGQTVEIEGQAGLWTITAIDDAVTPAGQDPNDNSILVLSGPALPVLTGEQKILGIDALVITTITVAVMQTETGGIVTRVSGSWEEDGFLEGHLVTVEMDADASQYRVLSISDDGLSMELEGNPLANETGATKTFWVQGSHGSLTVVHGGGNMLLEITGDMDQTTTDDNILIRLDGRDWAADGYAVGQIVQLSGEANTREIVAVVDADAALKPADAFGTWGTGSALMLSGPAFTDGQVELTVHVSEAHRTHVTQTMDITTSSLIRSAGTWASDGFYVGQQVWISGMAGPFTVIDLTSTVMELQNAALTPQDGVELTVFGFDPELDGGVRVGGDHITVSGGAGPDSPLVVYGDTSQDGVWYSGHPYDVLGMEFGEKPFDPYPNLPDGENEDDEWVFPLANPYTYGGNDVIDASKLFAEDLPTVGFVAYGGEGDDTIIGSQAGDHLAGGSGDDLIMGQRGVDHIYGDSGVNVNILTRALTINTVDNSPEPTVDNSLQTNGTTIDPYPSPVRDDLTAGRDVIYGDGPESAAGTLGDFDDIIFGDHGEIIQNVADPNLPPILLQKIQTTELSTVLAINSLELQNGNDDIIFGHLGRDILIGNAGNDAIDGDEADDLIFGDNVFLERRDGDDSNLVDDITNPRFQTLLGELLYSRSDQDPAFAGAPAPFADDSGELLTDGIWRVYRDPDGAPWWAEYLIDYASQHTFEFDAGDAGVGSFGNDYIAGGEAHDQIFGQLGNDVVQGDGGIELAAAGTSHVGASRTPDGTAGDVSDYIGDLDVVASFEEATDGKDYIEGGGGNDVIFGNLGQDDIIGGSSDFFSLGDPQNRPDGSDLLFGGAGTQIDRDGDTLEAEYDLPTDGTPENERHARDADTIVGDNGRIIRIVGTGGVDINPTGVPESQLYVQFNYDINGPADEYSAANRIVVRGVSLLDYTPGGIDFDPDNAANDIGAADEVHGETGDDTAYGGKSNDIFYGDADDDSLIGGYGHDWFSGGTGQDGVLGDDGRIFVSRNTAGEIDQFSEPLYAINFLLAEDPDPRHPQVIHGNVIDEFVYTPGKVQTETINVEGELKMSFDLTPFNLTPDAAGADEPLFIARDADDIIYGGLGDDFLHGGSGNDAISGAEALLVSYGQDYQVNEMDPTVLDLVGIVRSDWTRPYNAGGMLAFGEDDDPWNAPKPVQSRIGEFALYDEYDPRRVVRLNDDGSKVREGSEGEEWLLNFVSHEGPEILGYVEFAPNGNPIGDQVGRNTDGDDVMFGDLGNDWLVGGTGRDHIYGGWGNDLLNADDVLGTTDSVGDQGDEGFIPGDTDDNTDTHLIYEDRAYGGAGLDILIGNTGGDRLIDWVGEFNSYIVPFAPFGVAAVSRQVPPHLFKFLYAQSFSDGADPTRHTDTGNDAERNGEPDGEIGLVNQRDHRLWQDQTGGPTDPQPGNIPGGPRDVLRSADFNDGQMQGFFIDSGVWNATAGRMEVAPAALGEDAVSVFYVDEWLPSYFEMRATINAGKPIQDFKSNAYLIFDYQSPTDFKFAGVNISIDKIQMGYRDETGWHVVAQTPSKLRPNKDYNVLVAINGVTATLVVNNQDVFTYAFAPRVDEYGFSYGLNYGLVGIGSENSKAHIDNVAVLVLPPEFTFEETEEFPDTDATIAFVTEPLPGDW
jgi:Ca2+-binding RTX toxin-like protein